MSWLHGEKILVEEITWRGRLEFGIDILGETRPLEHQEFTDSSSFYFLIVNTSIPRTGILV